MKRSEQRSPRRAANLLTIASVFTAAVAANPAHSAGLGAGSPARTPPVVRIQLGDCDSVSPAALGRQSWQQGRQSYGVFYEQWTDADFDALKAKMAQCGDSTAFVDSLQQLQARRRARSKADQIIAAEQDAFGARRASTALSHQFIAELGRISGEPRDVLQQADDLLAMAAASAMNDQDKTFFEERVRLWLQDKSQRWPAADRDLVDKKGKDRLIELVAAVKATPATPEGLRQLSYLADNNRYRVPELSFPLQNNYYAALRQRISEIAETLRHDKCAPFTVKMGLGQEMASYEVVDQVGTRMGKVVCQSYVATGHGEFRPIGATSAGLYSVRSGDTTLVFQLGRYVSESGAFFPPSAPLQNGVPAFRFEGVRNGAVTRPVPRGFLINFLAQYTGPWTEFMREGD